MATFNKKTTKLSWEIGDYIKAKTKPSFSQGIELHTAWEKVASPPALEHTDNVVFSLRNKNKEILVYVDSSHWAAELGTQKELLRILMEKETGWQIETITFLVTRKASLRKIFQKQKEAKSANNDKSIPLTKSEDRYARELVAGIQNKELQNKVYKAMKADFEWKKGTEGLKLPQKPPESPEST
jgi:hypothetical protein